MNRQRWPRRVTDDREADDRRRDPGRGRVGHRGNDPRMARQGRRLRSRPTTRSSRSPPTRSTSSCPRRPAAPSAEMLAEEGDTVTVGQVIARIAVGDTEAAPAQASESGDTGTADGHRPRSHRHRRPAAPTSPLSRWRHARPRPRASISRASRAAVPAGASSRPTSSRRPAGAGDGRHRGGERRADAARTGAELLKGGAAVLARYMDESRSIPTATSFRTLTVTALDARRRELKAAGRKVSFTHLIAYAIARAAQDMPVMADHFAEIDGKPHRVRGRPGQPRPRGGRGEEGRQPHADGAGDPRRRAPALRALPRRLRRAGREGAHEHAHAPTTSRAPTSRSPTPAASARSPRCRG